MEKALAAELTKTEQIIKRTGLFDKIDDIYGEANAEYMSDQAFGGEEGGAGGGGGGGGFGGDTFGEDLGGGAPEGLEGETIEPGGAPEIGGAPEAGGPPAGIEAETSEKLESTSKKVDKLLLEGKRMLKEVNKERKDKYLTAYLDYINTRRQKPMHENKEELIVPIIDKAFIKNEETNKLISLLDSKLENKPTDKKKRI
jgi:hypothetical protein